MLILIAYLIHRKRPLPNFNSMDSAFMEEFHRKRKECGIVYASSDWLSVLLDQEFSTLRRGSIFPSVSEEDILSGPFNIHQMNQTAYIIKAILKQAGYGITISLGLENGPVICWKCQALEAGGLLEMSRIKVGAKEGGIYD